MLARREHGRAELARKLARHLPADGDPAEIERTLDQLQAKGLLSEQRFAAALTRTRGQRFGTARIKQELKQRGVPDEVIRASVEALRATELARATEVWSKRFGKAPADTAERARQMRFLAARGFSTEVIFRVVKGGVADTD